jgi:hypothetical protein
MIRFVPLFLLFAVSQFSLAQFKNILVDPGGSGSKPCEPSIAISRKDPKIIVAASVHNNVYYSSDAGMSWNKSSLKSPFGVWGDPAVITDFKGNFYYFHLSDPTGKNWESEEILDRIVLQESNDAGVTWSEGSSVGFNPPKDQDKEWATTDRKGNLFVGWTQYDKYGSTDTTCKSNIWFSRSSNGTKWSAPIQISQVAGDCKDGDNAASGAMPAVTGDGTQVFMAWANKGKIYLDRSFDGGTTWLRNDIPIVEQHGGWSMSVPGLQRCNGLPVLVCDNSKETQLTGALYMVWADQLNGENDTDIWFTRSLNFGDSWTPPIRINNDPVGKHQFLPWLAVDASSGYIYAVFYDRRNYDDNRTDVYISYSTNAGATFKNVKISETPFLPTADGFLGDYNGISASKGIITPIWTRMENGQTSVWTAVIKHEDLEKEK